jgi:SSS family solute:Na+ symporter
MGLIAVLYTAFGGIKAVIYTDTVQWLLLIFGLSCIGIPLAVYYLGGPKTILNALSPEFFSLNQITWVDLVNWAITIIPIWFVGMTLYQRIFASRSVQDAKKAWFIAGLFEWPIMAFMGVLLGVLARVAFEQNLFEPLGYNNSSALDPELGLPLLLRTILPTGLLGLLLSAYFSAILSTADSCLMAASGSVTTDLFGVKADNKWMNPILTLIIGAIAVIIAAFLENVLELMLYSYAFMVSGLFVPLTMGLLANKVHSWGAFLAMIAGGSCTLLLLLFQVKLPFNLDANLFGVSLSFLVYVVALRMGPPEKNKTYGVY